MSIAYCVHIDSMRCPESVGRKRVEKIAFFYIHDTLLPTPSPYSPFYFFVIPKRPFHRMVKGVKGWKANFHVYRERKQGSSLWRAGPCVKGSLSIRQGVWKGLSRRVSQLALMFRFTRQELFQKALQRFKKALSSFPAIILGRKWVENIFAKSFGNTCDFTPLTSISGGLMLLSFKGGCFLSFCWNPSSCRTIALK